MPKPHSTPYLYDTKEAFGTEERMWPEFREKLK